MRYIPWLLLLAVAWFGGCQYQKNRELGAKSKELKERIEARETVIAALAKQKARVDTQYVEAKKVYIAAKQGWDSIKVTLGEKVKIDPVVLAGDKAINACGDALRACGATVAARDALLAQKDTVIAQQDSLLDVERKRGPDWKTKLGWLLAGAALRELAP